MSAAQSSPYNLQDQDVLGELLHSLSQPLTTLRCSLEVTFDESPEPQAGVGIALQQTERVIGLIQLMREFLDAGHAEPGTSRISVDRVLRDVVHDAAPVAEARGVKLSVDGGSSATVCLAEPRLRLSLQYLAFALIDRAPAGSRVWFCLKEGSTESSLSGGVQGSPGHILAQSRSSQTNMRETLTTVKVAIAQRVLEAAGTLLTIEPGNPPGFALRIPRMLAASLAIV